MRLRLFVFSCMRSDRVDIYLFGSCSLCWQLSVVSVVLVVGFVLGVISRLALVCGCR